MMNWKRVMAAAGTAALLISNIGSVTQLTFATEPVIEITGSQDTPDADINTDDVEQPGGDTESGDTSTDDPGSQVGGDTASIQSEESGRAVADETSGTEGQSGATNDSNANDAGTGETGNGSAETANANENSKPADNADTDTGANGVNYADADDRNTGDTDDGDTSDDAGDSNGKGVQENDSLNDDQGQNDSGSGDDQGQNDDSQGGDQGQNGIGSDSDQSQNHDMQGNDQGQNNEGMSSGQDQNGSGDENGNAASDTTENLGDDTNNQNGTTTNQVTDQVNEADDPDGDDKDDESKESEIYSLDDSLTVTLKTRESSKREVTRDENDDAYLYDLGETASTTLTLTNPEEYALDETDGAVVRVYMQFEDAVAQSKDSRGKTKSPGTYAISADDDATYTYSIYEIKDGLYGYEFERPIHGDSYEVELTSVYKDDTDGGTNRIWAAVLSEDEARDLDGDVTDATTEDADDRDSTNDEDADDSSNDVDTELESEESDREDRDKSEGSADDKEVIGVADQPEDKEDIITLRWLDSEITYPEFRDEQTMSDGTVITVDAPEGAFPEGIRLDLEVRDAADYLDVIRAYTGDETLTADEWLAYDFNFYTDEDHREIEPLSNIKVTFSNLSRLTEIAEQTVVADAELGGTTADDAGSDSIMMTDLASNMEEADIGDATAVSEGVGSGVVVYHIANTGDADDVGNGSDAVTETTVTNVDPESGTIEIESSQFSIQLLDLNYGISLAAGQATSSTTVNHIDIGISANAAVTINGQQQTVNVTLERSDFASNNVTVSAKYQNGSGTPSFTTNNYSNITTSSGTSGITQFRVGGTYQTGTLSNPAVYTFTLKKDVTFTLDGKEITIPVTLSESFHYFQSDNDCPGIHNGENTSGRVSDESGMDFVLKFDLKLISVYKEVVDESGNPLPVDNDCTYNFTVDKSVDSEGVPVKVSSNSSSGFGIEQVSEIGEVTLTENQPPSTVVSGGQTYNYVRTEITADGETEVTTELSKTANNVGYFTVKNVYSGKPLVVEKKWYENNGSVIENDDGLPGSITGKLYQIDHVAADPGKKADDGVTLTVDVEYSYSYSYWYGTYMRQTQTYEYTVATDGSYSGYVYGYYSDRRGETEKTVSSVSLTSGSASVSNNGNNIAINNITENTTVKVTYATSDLINNAPVINNPQYDQPDRTIIEPTPESTETRVIEEFTLAPSDDSDKNWRYEFSAEDLNEQAGHTYQYYVEEVKVPGYSTSVDYGSASNALTKTNTAYTITISNTKGYELPETGGAGTVPFEVGGSAAILGAMCIGYSRRRRDRKEGEM